VTGISSTAVNKSAVAGNGANGDVVLDFVPCDYDLAVTKTVDNPNPAPGDTVTWTVVVTNNGANPMIRGDVVTLTDSLPGPGAKTVTSVTVAGGSNGRALARGAVTCGISAGSAMTGTVTCSRPYSDGVVSSPNTGNRGLDPGESVTIVYTQAIPAGAATGQTYTNTATVTDRGAAGDNTATRAITIAETPPVATDDSASTPFNNAVTLPGATNDTAGSGAINLGSVVFTSAAATNNGKTLVTSQGTWQVNGTGTVTFSPAAGYTGTTPPVEYRVTDANGLSDTADLTATVRPGPTANPDTTTTAQDQDVTLDPLANDTPGPNGDGSDGSWVASSVVFNPANIPAGSTISNAGKTLTVPGEGVYTINATSGAVTFDPAPTFVGQTTAVGYTVTDSHGNPASSTIRITVSGVSPVASDDSRSTTFNTPVDLPATLNDTPGPGGAIDPAQTVFTSPSATNGGKTLTTTQGTWQVNGDGSVTFTPAAGYVGTTPAVEYRITDANGQTDTADLRVTVRPGPSAVPDPATTKQNVDVDVTPFANDTPSQLANGNAGEFDPTSVLFPAAGQPGTATVTDGGRTLTIPGEGVYTVNPTTGVVTFDPEPQFSGPASPIRYVVTDTAGNQTGSQIRITVTPVTPVAGDDAVKTPAGQARTFDPLANDVPGDTGAPIVPGSIRFTSPQATDNGRRLEVPGQGTWVINPDNTVTFTPAAGFEGQTTPPVEYSVADANGTTDTATMTAVVGRAPLAAPDQGTTPQNVDITVNTLGNDIPGDEGDPCAAGETPPVDCDTGTFDPATVQFPATGQPGGATPTNGGRTLVIAGEGTYTINQANGDITFDPVPGFTGNAQPVRYQVTDSYNNTASSTVAIRVTPIRPEANDDIVVTPYNTAVTLPGAQDDVPGELPDGTDVDIVDADTVFPTANQPATATVAPDGKRITVPGEGVYVMNADGSVTFTPDVGFSGATTPVTYRIVDTNGTTAQAQLFVTVQPGPDADDDARTTPQNVNVNVNVLGNDAPGNNPDGTPGTWVASSVVFPTTGQPGTATVSPDGKTLTVPNQGVYTVQPDGTITFDPEPGFTGAAAAITYQATDSLNNPASAQVRITVTAITPTANDDAAVTAFDTPVTFDFAGNDVAGAASAPIDEASGTFEAGDNPAGWTITNGGKTITVPNEGAYTLNDDGTVTFTPVDGFTGPTTAVTYTIRDENGTAARADLTVLVRPGPTAVDDTDTTPQNVTVTTTVLDDDVPGQNADGTSGTWVTSSVRFVQADQAAGAVVSDAGKTLTVPDEGVYTVNADGTITFDPGPQFTGPATPVVYTVTDSLGNDASAELTITVSAITPTANDDSANTPFDTPVTFDFATNDVEGAASAPIDDASGSFQAGDNPAGWTISNGGKTITVPNEGAYTLNDDGTVTFTPQAGYAGTTTAATYTIRDTNGTPAKAELQVTVRPGPVAVDDDETTPQNVTIDVDVLGDDVPGPNADNTAGSWDATSVRFVQVDQDPAAVVSNNGKTLTVPGEGEYTVQTDGSIIFDPVPQFTGPATPVVYTVTDSHGNDASAELTITVTGIDPMANDDAASTSYDTPVTLPGATDDTAGAVSAPLVPGSTVFPATGQPTGAIVSPDGKTITVPGEGTYVIRADGSVEFTPVAGYTGTTNAVTYRIEDTNGTTDTAQLTVTVRRGPSASPDDATTPQNVDVTVPVLGNDSAGLQPNGDPGSFDLTSLVFPTAGQPTGATVSPDGRTLTVPGEGVYAVNADGTVTFDPVDAFTGVASTVTYTVTDQAGNDVSSTLVVTVAPVVPVATDDAASTPYNTAVTLPGATNDTAGAASAPLVPGSTVFTTTGQPSGATVSPDGRTVTVPGQGTWVILADGSVTFTPVDGFSGATSPVGYRIEDTNGTTDTAQLTVTVRPAPKAVNDTGTTPQNVDLTVAILGNDVPGPNADGTAGSWVASSVVFTTAGQPAGSTLSVDGKTLTVPGQGAYTVNADGTVTFDPLPGFTGAATPVTYAVTDSHGNRATATVTITVTAVASKAVDDRETTPHATPVVIDVLANDTPGSPSAPFVASTLHLVDPTTSQEVDRVVVPGEGVWTVGNGQVRFEPEKGFSGTATPIDYVVSDTNGTQTRATITVVVGPAGAAKPDKDQTTPGTPVAVDVLGNDQAAPGEEMVPGSVCLLPGSASGKVKAGSSAPKCVKEYTLPGVGTWVVNANGTITFTPAKGYTGTASIDYTVTDTGDNVYEATLSVTVKGDPEVAPSEGEGKGGGILPDTGGPAAALVVTALGLLLAGAAMVLASRRRQPRRQ
jgi:LPXTG-motif cell wall-anchored protein